MAWPQYGQEDGDLGDAGAMVSASLCPVGASSLVPQLVKVAQEVGALWMPFDAPLGAAGGQALESLGRTRWTGTMDTAICSELGDAIAQCKQWVLATCDAARERPRKDGFVTAGESRHFQCPWR